MRRLDNKTAIVTGAAGVLCSVMTEALLEEGARVALIDLNEEGVNTLKNNLLEKGFRNILALRADVLDSDSLILAEEKIQGEWGGIDILLNGAGGNHPGGTCTVEQMDAGADIKDTFFGLDLSSFEWVNRLNFMGSLLPVQVFCRSMLERGGCVINISSMSATQPMTKVAAYSAAKAAVDNFTRWLAVHLAPMNVRVNAIAPGFFSTNQNRFLLFEQDGHTLTPRGRKIIDNTPMHRFGKPEDLKGALKFLVSDEASFVTGSIMPVDGGFLAYSGV